MLVIVLFGAPVPLLLMVWFLFAAPEFGRVFSDFAAALPRPTRLVLQSWWGPLVLAGYLLALPAPLVFRSNVTRDFALLCVVIGGLLVVMASAAALYLPFVQMAEQVR